MEKAKTYKELSDQLTSDIPSKTIEKPTHYTHFTSIPLSLMIHTKDSAKKLFSIQYLDMHTRRKITFRLDDLSSESLTGPQKFHNHNFYELMVLCSGEIRVSFEGLEYIYHAGDACLVNRDILHNEGGEADYEALFLSISPDYLSSEAVHGAFTSPRLAGKMFSDFFRNDRKNEGSRKRSYMDFFCLNQPVGWTALKSELEMLQKEMRGRKSGYDFIVCGILLRIFSILTDKTLYRAKNIDLGAAREKDLLEEACRYIDRKKTHVSARELAEAMSFSQTYISRIFKKYLGQTVLQYNRTVCLREAERLLLSSDLSVSEISHRVGFENRTHFYRLFREEYGMTPQQYRSSSDL